MSFGRKDDIDNPYLMREVQITRLRDILVFLPFFAAFFFLSPVMGAATEGWSVFGVPLGYVQIFLFWLFIIIFLRLVNKALLRKLDERGQ